MSRALTRILSLILIVLALGQGRARAAEPRRAGTVRLETTAGRRGPLDLVAGQGGYVGELAIVNGGKEPLVVSRLAVRGDASDPRVPPKLAAHLTEGSLPVTIPPGASRRATVLWTPERGIRQRQLFGHVVVTTSDEQSGEVAMGVRAHLPSALGPLEPHVLSLLLGAPVIGAVLTFLARARGRKDDRTPHLITVVALALQAILAIYIYRGFSPDVARIDGNDGLQFVERAVWVRALSAELYLGVDGIAASALLVASVVAFFAMLPERTIARGASGYHAAFLVLDAALCGALVAMDALLFVLFSAIACVAAVFLVGAWGGTGRRRAATRLGVTGVVAVMLLLVAVLGAARHADPTFLVDGAKTSTTFGMPDLSRVALGAKDATLFGGPVVKVGFVLVLLASLMLMAAFPLHGWLADALAEAPAATGALVSLALPTIGATAFLRLGVAVLPEGMRWASGVVVALGAVTAAFGALSALAEKDLRRLVACATTTQAGFVLIGAGSLTPQGMSGAMVTASSRALACGVFLLLAGAIDDRVRTREVTKLDGIAAQMPGYATALAAAALGQAGVLGLGGAWGPLLALLGALPSYAPLAIAAGCALVVLGAAHLFAVARVAFGTLDPAWQKSPLLEPFGGRFPDLSPREWTSIAPLVTLVVVLGLWPAPLLAVTTGTAKDLANAVSPPGPDQIALR